MPFHHFQVRTVQVCSPDDRSRTVSTLRELIREDLICQIIQQTLDRVNSKTER